MYETIRAKRMISFLLCVSLLSLTAAFFLPLPLGAGPAP